MIAWCDRRLRLRLGDVRKAGTAISNPLKSSGVVQRPLLEEDDPLGAFKDAMEASLTKWATLPTQGVQVNEIDH